MAEIFLKTLPFFALIGLGYGAAASRFFAEEATAWLTKFVFYFALPAMIFRFAASLSLGEILDWSLVAAYLWGTLFVYGLATLVGLLRGLDVATNAVEAQCAVIGNVGFLGLPMLALLLGDASIGPNLLVLAVDLIVFSSLIVILISIGKTGRLDLSIFRTIGRGLIENPMIVSIVLGLGFAALPIEMPEVANEFLVTLGNAATPCALFAIGASLASKSAERISIALYISTFKLVLHPAFVAFAALYIFEVDAFGAGVIISAAALPVAGNIFILAQHYGVAPQRVSAAILVSTLISVLTVSGVIAWAATLN
ncbi:AEC family transporter [Pseudaestuariivita atlantica]|uniref:Malate transporter n=1 Tax=Pseudaestuariivita atlantica TaxID=1317121 RepID=A0A0L1JN89_9RHOB|nr:AEC family transporter [Pseudaestuariivita atlantica]KNG93221.1 malate transporter [Pseudaestuariivita atlantica]